MQIINTTSSYFSIAKLSEGVYAAIAKKGEGAMSNAGFIDLGDEVLIFDTFVTPNAARDLRKVTEDITQKKLNMFLIAITTEITLLVIKFLKT
ncbi:hypothetical protein WAZ07_02095 [Bacillus sp. FJAT-51639]|uniref:Uncharacterized protein n=1 Tax=Bacillus bruguierae TaxID=3127667 RepID=A0ABU8FBT1_9BACI